MLNVSSRASATLDYLTIHAAAKYQLR